MIQNDNDKINDKEDTQESPRFGNGHYHPKSDIDVKKGKPVKL